jgi:hypothetical protein
MADHSTAKTDFALACALDSAAQATSATDGSDGAVGSSTFSSPFFGYPPRAKTRKKSRASDANFDQLCAHHDRERLLPQSRLNRSCEYRGCGTSDSIIEKQGRV